MGREGKVLQDGGSACLKTEITHSKEIEIFSIDFSKADRHVQNCLPDNSRLHMLSKYMWS